MNTVEQMNLFMEPKSIAIVGVSRKTDENTWNILGNLLNYGFQGKIYPVNPTAEQILGMKSYPSLKAIPDEIDLAVIATPRFTVLDIVKECIDKGIKAIIVIAQGFADSDEEGKKMQSDMVRIATDGGARIMGPNTFGVANAFRNLCTALPLFKLEKTPVGVICQTGLFFLSLSRFRYGKIIDLGNTCDVDLADALQYFDNDPDIKVINLHIEGIRQGEKFFKVAKQVVKKKPVIALKTGRSEYAATAAQSHTGSLTGKDKVYEAMFKQCGIIRADDIEEMEDVSSAFVRLPPMQGQNLAILSWAGSTGVMAVDACQKYGLKVPKLSSATQNRIQQLSPPDWLPVNNPVDLWACIGLTGFQAQNFKKDIQTLLEALLAEDHNHGLLVAIPDFLELFPSELWDISSTVRQAADTFRDRPLVFATLGRQGKLMAKIDEIDNAIIYPNCERAVRALARLCEYSTFLNKPDK